MKKVLFFPFLLLVGCSESEIAKDAKVYCDCVKMKPPGDACLPILQELDDKYAFDPEAAEALKDEINNCLPAE